MLLAGWGEIDRTELWLEAIARSGDGLHIDLLPDPLQDPHFEGVQAKLILLWAEGKLTSVQRTRYLHWQQLGLPVSLLGSAAVLLQTPPDEEPDAIIR
ncbi:hypothetical protein O1V64_22030 [Rouxiella badensis]|nr:hypothetical protein O1V64_22030 [Rouxiella badensis]